MSLVVWLPLTKDLRQQGLSNVTVTNNGATFNSAGKLGGCYSFGNGSASSNGLFLNSNLVDLMQEEYSVAVWVKPLGNHYHYNGTIFSSGNWNNTCYAFGLSQDNSQVDILCKGYNIYLTCAVPVNTWTHLVCTCDINNVVRLYKNGEYIGSSTRSNKPDSDNATQAAIGRETYASGYFTFNGMLNDFRLYDHCLSPMEVKQISQGLVLHYPLNRQGWGQENLIANTDFNGVSKKFTVTSGTEGGFTFTPTETIIANTQYTISCRLRGNANMNLYKLCTGGNESISWVNRSQLSTTEYRYFSIIFTYPSNKTLNQIYICTRYGTANTQVGDWFEIEPSSLKLEKGSIATPWCPNSSDTLATTMGLNSTTEYDCSGFCNNGIQTGTFAWTSDTPKYQVSTNFNGSNYVGLAPPDSEIQTVAFWVKWSNIPSTQTIGFIDDGSGLAFGLSYGNIIVSCQVAGAASCYNASVLSANNWYHIVVIKTGTTTRKLYINAIEQTANSTSNYWSYINNELQIGKRKNTGEGIIGWMSDFRMYATILSADDVKSLYQNSAYIDSSGNVYGAVHTEV